MSEPMKIVYGQAAATGIANVLGFAAADSDMAIEDIGTATPTTVDGETRKVVVSGRGKKASGNIVVPNSEMGKKRFGEIVQIAERQAPNAWRPYRIEEWKVAKDEDTGLSVAAFTAVSEDSMVEEYNLGPRDADTGELVGNKRLLPCNFHNGDVDTDRVEGKVFGLFANTLESGDGTMVVSRAKARSSNAVALATCHNGRLDFYAAPGSYYLCQVSDGLGAGAQVFSTEEGFFASNLFAGAPMALGGDVSTIDTVA